MLSMCGWLICSTSCQTRVVVLPSDLTVVRLPAGQPYTPAAPGWLVPDARMQQILEQLSAKQILSGSKTNAAK